MRINLVRDSVGLLILLVISLIVGCSLQQVRPQALTPGQSDLSHVKDGLTILLVRLDGSHHILSGLEILNLDTQESFSHTFYDSSDLGSSYLKFNQMGGDNGALEHMVFLDIPHGKYQITSVQISDKGHQSIYRISDLSSIFFEFSQDSPVYLGELFISLGK